MICTWVRRPSGCWDTSCGGTGINETPSQHLPCPWCGLTVIEGSPKRPRLSHSRAKGVKCSNCLSTDVRGMPTEIQAAPRRTFKCASCGDSWTHGRTKKGTE